MRLCLLTAEIVRNSFTEIKYKKNDVEVEYCMILKRIGKLKTIFFFFKASISKLDSDILNGMIRIRENATRSGNTWLSCVKDKCLPPLSLLPPLPLDSDRLLQVS